MKIQRHLKKMRALTALFGAKAETALAVVTDLATAAQTINSVTLGAVQVPSIDSASFPGGKKYLVIGMISGTDSVASTAVTMELRINGTPQASLFFVGTGESGVASHYQGAAAGIFIPATAGTFGVQADSGAGHTLTAAAWQACIIVVPLN